MEGGTGVIIPTAKLQNILFFLRFNNQGYKHGSASTEQGVGPIPLIKSPYRPPPIHQSNLVSENWGRHLGI